MKSLNSIRPSDMPRLILMGVLILLAAAAGYQTYSNWRTPLEQQQEATLLAYQQTGRFNYLVQLKPNSVFNTREVGPGMTYFTALADGVRVSFDYELQGVGLPEQKPVEYQVLARLEEPGRWSKEYVLEPLRHSDGSVSTQFSLPLTQYLQTIDAVQKETGSRSQAAQLVIEAQVQPSVATPQGAVTTPFTQTLTLNFTGETFQLVGEPEVSKPGAITRTIFVPRPEVTYLRYLSLGALVFSLVLLAFHGFALQRAHRLPPTQEEFLLMVRRAYKQQLAEVVALPDLPGQVRIRVRSLEDLAHVAEELMKPLLVISSANGCLFAVIDSAERLRYEFVRPLAAARPSVAPVHADAHGAPVAATGETR